MVRLHLIVFRCLIAGFLKVFVVFSSLSKWTSVKFIRWSHDRLNYVIIYLHFSCRIHLSLRSHCLGRAIAQTVIRRLPTAAARVRGQIISCGIFGGQSGTGAGFLRVLRFLLPILIPPTAPHSSSIIRSWYNRPVSGRRTKWTRSHPTQRN
jgi:hypothetical protein